MNQIFERALANALRRRIDGVIHHHSKTIVGAGVGAVPSLTFIPDIIVFADGKPALVLDAKYKNPIVQAQYRKTFDSGNVYQIVSYAKAFECRGILVYPEYDEVVDMGFLINDVAFRTVTVNLAAGAASELHAFANSIAESLGFSMPGQRALPCAI